MYVASGQMIFKGRFCIFSIRFDKQVGRFEKTTDANSIIVLIKVQYTLTISDLAGPQVVE